LTAKAFRHSIGAMEHSADSLFMEREIEFRTLHPDPNQAGSAAVLLIDIEGIHRAEPLGPATLQVAYHLTVITLADIEQLLERSGYHLENGLVYKIRRALYHYTEETQRANLGCPKGDANCTQKVFANRYRKREHGCQDERPEHWRHYL